MEITMSMIKELRDRTEAGFMDCKKALTECDGNMDEAIDWLRKKGAATAVKKGGRIAAEGLAKIVADGNKALLVEMNCETDFAAGNQNFKDLVNNATDWILKNNPKDVEEALNNGVQEMINDATAKISEKITLRRFEVVEKADDEAFGLYTHMNNQIVSVAVCKPADTEVATNMAMQIAAMSPSYVSEKDVPTEIVEHERNLQKEIMDQDPSNAKKPEDIQVKILEGRVSKALKDMCLVDQEFFLDTSTKVGAYLKSKNVEVTKFARLKVGEGIEKKQENFAEEVANAF